MGIVVQFRRPVASPEVIAMRVELGYLRRAKRHKAGVIENAVEQLRQDLHRDGVISAGDLSHPALAPGRATALKAKSSDAN
jgi:hypothetical protein